MKETAKTVVGQATTYGLQLLVMVAVARVLGPAAQGEFSVLRTAVYLGEAFLWLGLTSGLTYLVARDDATYHDPLVLASGRYLVVALAVVTVGLTLAAPLAAPGTTFAPVVMNRGIFVLWLGSLAGLQVLTKVFVGRRQFRLYNRVNVLNAALLIPGLAIVALAGGITVRTVAVVNVAANLGAIGYAVWNHRDALASAARHQLSVLRATREAYAVGAKAYASTLAFLILYRLDFFFVAHFRGAQALGVYTIAVFAIEAAQKVPDWLGTLLAPQVAAGGDPAGERTRRYAIASVSAVALFGLAVAILRMVGGDLVERALGAGYAGVEMLVVLLLPRALLHALMVIYAGHLAGKGYTLFHPVAGILAVAALGATDFFAIPRFGLRGAAFGITVAYLFATAIMLVGYRRTRRSASASAVVPSATLTEAAR